MTNGGGYKIFAGGLPRDCTEDDLMYVFGTYGDPVQIHLMEGKSNSGQSCAFVIYDTVRAAESAIAALDGVYSLRDDGSAPIRVSWARPGHSGARGRESAYHPGRAAPPARGGASAAPAYRPSRGASVGRGGAAMASSARPYYGYGGSGYGGSGYGGSGYGGSGYGGSGRRSDYGSGGANSRPPLRTQGGGGPSPAKMRETSTLFVGNLPSDISQDALDMVFSTYGKVTKIHVMVGRAKSGQACAFIEYQAPVDAETAVLTLHEKYEIRPGDGAIVVRYASFGSGNNRSAPY